MADTSNFERNTFNDIFRYLQSKYPDSKVTMRGTLVYKNDECIFNTEGYNLLYNLSRLCEAYKEELK